MTGVVVEGAADVLKPRDRALAAEIEASLVRYEQAHGALPGIATPERRRALVRQLVASVHRRRYLGIIAARDVGGRRDDPADPALFHPRKAALLHARCGDHDEACWLVFLTVHFGRHPRGGWKYARDVYGRLGGPGRWDWAAVSADPRAFRTWLAAHTEEIRAGSGFGNHRKRESLDARSARGTGAAVESYVAWIAPPRTHRQVFDAAAAAAAGGDPRATFAWLFASMAVVASFGRTARFDYLATLGTFGLAPVEPGSPHLTGATGPLRGMRLLVSDRREGAGPAHTPSRLERQVAALDAAVPLGFQVWEDALCNWQKVPDRYVPYRG